MPNRREQAQSKMEQPEGVFPPREELEALRERIAALEGRKEEERAPQETPRRQREQEPSSEQEVKKEIREYLQETQEYPGGEAPLPARTVKELKKLTPVQQTGVLVALALQEGLGKATETARSLGDPAVLDEFHDILVDRYYEALVRMGAIS